MATAEMLNVDATMGTRRRTVGIGGVLRNSVGAWYGGFASLYPVSRSEECEAWVVLKDMEWAWQQGIQILQIQIDAEIVVNWINGDVFSEGPARLIIMRCRQWLAERWDVTVVFVNKEKNQVANAFARMACWNEIQ